jgi:hypothetical protein
MEAVRRRREFKTREYDQFWKVFLRIVWSFAGAWPPPLADSLCAQLLAKRGKTS